MNVSDFAGGTGTPERDGPVDDAAAADATTSQPPASRRGRRLGLIAAAIGVLGAAVWFVGPSLMPEQCFFDGVEVPCEEIEERLAAVEMSCFADPAMTVEVPCEEATELVEEQCFVNGVEVPCDEVDAIAGKCFADEARSIEIPCDSPATIEDPPLDGQPVEKCALDGIDVPCEDLAALDGKCFSMDEPPVEIPCPGIGIDPNPLLLGRDISVSGFPTARLDDAQALHDRVAPSVFVVGPVPGPGAADDMVVQGTSWLIHPRFAVTNAHVIEGIRSSPLAARTSGDTQVRLHRYPDKQPVRGRVVGVDEAQDVAIIELLGSVNADPIPVSDRPAVVGEPVMYVGHPGTMKQLWITGLGVVTGYLAPLSATSVTSTAPAHAGASGSPLINLDGEVVSLVTGSLQNACPIVEWVECVADASVQYASLPVGPTASRGIDGQAIRQFFTQVTGEVLPPAGTSTGSSGERVLVDVGSVGSFAVYRDRERESERGRTTTISGFPVSERDTVAALYEQVSEAVFLVESVEGAPMGTAWLAGPTTVVTNEHVSTPARSGDEVLLTRRDGSQLTARIVEESVRDDVAILRLDAPVGTTPLPIARQNVGVDAPVFYVGHPAWMEQSWITGLGVTTGYDTRHRNRMLTTVPSESGASGSPILNLQGEVVAINTFRTSGAIPAGGYPVADRDDQYFSVPVSRGSGGVDASTLRSYVERHLD